MIYSLKLRNPQNGELYILKNVDKACQWYLDVQLEGKYHTDELVCNCEVIATTPERLKDEMKAIRTNHIDAYEWDTANLDYFFNTYTKLLKSQNIKDFLIFASAEEISRIVKHSKAISKKEIKKYVPKWKQELINELL